MVRHVETGLTLAAVDDYADGDWFGAVSSALGECLDYAATTSDDILDDEHLLARSKFEISAQCELVVYFFKEDEAKAELAGDFLSNHQPTHCGTDHSGGTIIFEHWQNDFSKAGNFIHVLADLGALKKVRAVQARAK